MANHESETTTGIYVGQRVEHRSMGQGKIVKIEANTPELKNVNAGGV